MADRNEVEPYSSAITYVRSVHLTGLQGQSNARTAERDLRMYVTA